MIGRSRDELGQLFPTCEIIEPAPNEIQLDFDAPTLPAFFKLKATRFLERVLGLEVVSVVTWNSRGGNVHVVIALAQEAPLDDRVTWAALLGSDKEREKLNWVRAKRGHDFAVCLLRPSGAEITTINE